MRRLSPAAVCAVALFAVTMLLPRVPAGARAGAPAATARSGPAAATATFAPVADAYVESSKPTKNHGRESRIKVDSSPAMTAYLKFAVQGLAGSVTSATLTLYPRTWSPGGFDVRGVADTSWQETAITARTAPPPSATVTRSSGPLQSGRWVSLDVTPLVGGSATVSMALTTTSSSRIELSSREDAAFAPALVVQTGESDTTSPSVPTLSATAPAPDRVDLSWTAATDDTGVSGYTVYRDGTPIATQAGTGTAYSDGSAAGATTYSYQVDAFDAAGNRSPRSVPANVTTPVPDPVVAAVGNIACDPLDPSFNAGAGTSASCRAQATAQLAMAAGPAAVLALGDTQYECAGPAAYQRSYDASWGPLKAITHPAVGNHEYYNTADSPGATDCSATRTGAGYFGYFGAAAGDPATAYYSFDVGTWHLISLNSNCWKVSCGPLSPQVKWLKADLAAHPGQCTLAYWHHPRFSSGQVGSNPAFDPFWQELYAAHADVVLNAHDHDYERFAPQSPLQVPDPYGIREFVLGTGGRSLGTILLAQPNSEVRSATAYGVLLLTLHPAGYDWRFVPANGSSFTDSGSGTCH